MYQDFQNKFEAKLEGFLAANGYTTEQMVDACKAQVNNEGAMGAPPPVNNDMRRLTPWLLIAVLQG